MNYDPDGHEKRRAKKGEKRCGGCKQFFPPYNVKGYSGIDMDGYWVWHRQYTTRAMCEAPGQVLGVHVGFGEIRDPERPCRADDHAGDCKHYKEATR